MNWKRQLMQGAALFTLTLLLAGLADLLGLHYLGAAYRGEYDELREALTIAATVVAVYFAVKAFIYTLLVSR